MYLFIPRMITYSDYMAYVAKFKLDREKSKAIFFGSKEKRPLIPDKPPTFRIGVEHYYKSPFPVDPGSYEVEQKTANSYLQKKKTSVNKKGWGFSNRGSPKIAEPKLSEAPPPTYYQPDIPEFKTVEPSAAPFNTSAKRVSYFDENIPCTFTPGPGFYYPTDVVTRTYEKKCDFGDHARIVMPVTLECFTEFADKCVVCDEIPIGDYWRKKEEVMCRPCHDMMCKWFDKSDAEPPYSGPLDQFKKYRNCESMHDHNGCDIPVRTASDKFLKKLKTKEAYLNLYHT